MFVQIHFPPAEKRLRNDNPVFLLLFHKFFLYLEISCKFLPHLFHNYRQPAFCSVFFPDLSFVIPIYFLTPNLFLQTEHYFIFHFCYFFQIIIQLINLHINVPDIAFGILKTYLLYITNNRINFIMYFLL